MVKLKPLFLFFLLSFFLLKVFGHEGEPVSYGLVSKESRELLAVSESGSISAVDVRDGARGAYHLQFITMEPGSLFLPVLLHSDMVFYVHSGRGRISYIEEEDHDDENKDKEKGGTTKSFDLERGDVSRLKQGTIFYMKTYPSQTREKFRVYAIFNTIENPQDQFFRAYSNISDMVRGFDDRILQTGFGVSEELIQSIKWAERSPPIVPDTQRNETEEEQDKNTNAINWKEGIIESIVGVKDPIDYSNKKKSKDKDRTFNFYSAKPDVKNCYGWSRAVSHKDTKALKRSDIGAFMVNLTTGSMMGPHWNPRATEISIVTHGQGMVQIICPTNPSGQLPETQFACQNSLFRVNEGDLFIVPKFHPMAQIAFNNDSFVFVGFTTNAKRNYPQFLAGGRSVLNVIDRDILARAFNVLNESVVDEFLSKQKESIILECISCAEGLVERVEEQERRREEERKRQEEEARAREEKERRRQEEEQKRQQEEEQKRREEEQQRRQQEEEERRRQQEEEEQRRQQEEEEQRRQQKEEQRQQEEQEQRRQQEEEQRRQQEEQEQRRQQEEEEQRRQQEEEEERTREEERRRQQEEEERTREEERIRKEEEEQARAQQERRRRRQEQEEEETRRQEEEEEEETRRREEEEGEEEEEEEEGEEWLKARKLPNKKYYG